MANNLFNLFSDELKKERDLVASDPQTIDSLSTQVEEQEKILSKANYQDEVQLRIDYSDFSNFVFFNSALDYFNITGEKILNEYPLDGNVTEVEDYTQNLDGYQKHVLNTWPSRNGYLYFNPAISSSYIKIEDNGVDTGVARSSFITPGTGSFSIEFWANIPGPLTGSNDAYVIFQKLSGSTADSLTAWISSSYLYFTILSASNSSQVSCSVGYGETKFYSLAYNNENASSQCLLIYTGSNSEFPVLCNSSSVSSFGSFNIGPGAAYIGSGSVSQQTVRPLTGSLDNVSLWSINRKLSDITASFNCKDSSQRGLIATYRFNETGSIVGSNGLNQIVLDNSGHRLNGRIQNYFTSIRRSGSLVTGEKPDPILDMRYPEVVSYISEQQVSGTAYDRNNDNIVTNFFPSNFFQLESDENQTQNVLRDFLFVLARNFDFLKQRIDQFINVMKVSYDDFNQAPDALLSEVAKYFGWEFKGSFLSADAVQYLLGKKVIPGTQGNIELDRALSQIKTELWRRTLVNLSYIYKTKGTRESVEALLRSYGINKNFARLKEYGLKKQSGIQTHRVLSEKSSYSLGFGSGSYGTLTASITSSQVYTTAQTAELRVKFPTTTSVSITASIATGSLWSVVDASAAPWSHVYYIKDSVSSHTGTLYLSSSEGVTSITGAAIFNGDWYNISSVRDYSSGSLSLNVRSLDRGVVTTSYSSSISASITVSSSNYVVTIGSSNSRQAQYWAQEFRLWDRPLRKEELDDHTLNFQSYGAKDLDGATNDLRFHLRLKENSTASLSGELSPAPIDISGYGATVRASSFDASISPYRKFLNEYSYITPPDFGWNEDKIRIYNGSKVPTSDIFDEDRLLSLEFNMIDALNEDISQMLSSLNLFNYSIGAPHNRYRDSYVDLDALKKKYFSKLQRDLNFKIFFDMLEFYDRSFIDMVRRLIPARADFIGDEFVVESHMLERPKHQWGYRRQIKSLNLTGVIRMFRR